MGQRNYIKSDNSRKKRSPKFTIEASCQMKDCTSKVSVQQGVDAVGKPLDHLTFTFFGEIRHRKGDIQARRIIDEEKSRTFEAFSKDTKLNPGEVYTHELGAMSNIYLSLFKQMGN